MIIIAPGENEITTGIVVVVQYIQHDQSKERTGPTIWIAFII